MNKIDRNKKTTLNKSDVNRLKMVAKTFPNFLNSQVGNLYNKLENKYKNKGTLSVICYSLKKLFNDLGQNKKAEYFGNQGKELSQDVSEQEAKNELTNNEIKNWKTQEEILNIMNNIPLDSWTNYMRFLLLNLCTRQPPLRKGVYCTLKFLTKQKDDDGESNYILLNDRGKCFIIVNKDKVSKFDNFKKKENTYIEMTDPDLIDMLKASYKAKKREYVFTTDKFQPYSMESITKILLVYPFGLNFNILRSSYITAFYKSENGQTLYDKQELAKKMRHSTDRALKSYNKILKRDE